MDQLLLTPEKRLAFLDALRDVPNVTRAARSIGVSRARMYQVYEAEPDFAKQWDEALEEGVECMEAEAHRRGFEGTDKPLVHQGEFTYLRDFDAIDPLTDEKYPPHQAPIKRDKNGRPIVATMKEYSDTLCIFLLKAHAPDKYRERVDVGHTSGTDLAQRLIEGRRRVGG